MTAAQISLLLSVFVASAVEAVEAVTIVLAAGVSRSWKSATLGVFAAVLSLAAVILIFGPSIALIPIEVLRLVVGVLLLLFGLQWLRKAILRASGHKALHDEAAIFERELKEARAAAKSHWLVVDDWYGFTLSFKGVLLEGLEVAFIVVTFGALQKQIGLASIAALAACIFAALLGFAIKAPLTKVPENTMKFFVGVMLVSFGIFWAVEGVGAAWSLQDISIPLLIVWVIFSSGLVILYLRRFPNVQSVGAKKPVRSFGAFVSVLRKIWLAIWDFVVGEDWKLAGLAVAFIFLTALTHASSMTWLWLCLGIPASLAVVLRSAVTSSR